MEERAGDNEVEVAVCGVWHDDGGLTAVGDVYSDEGDVWVVADLGVIGLGVGDILFCL